MKSIYFKPWTDERNYQYPDKLLRQYIPQEIFDFFDRLHDPNVPDIDLFGGYDQYGRKIKGASIEFKIGDCVCTIAYGGIHIEEMERRFMHYLETCAKYDMKIGNQAAYAAIGIDKGIAWEWVNRCTTNPARTDFIKKVQKVCALYREGLMQDGKVNPVTGIFWQKNYDGMKDQTEMVLTPNNPLGDSTDTEALARKYLDNADIVDVPEGEISEVAEKAESPKIK